MRFSKMTRALLIAGCLMLSSGIACTATAKPKIISADREIKRVKAAKPFTSAIDGWFVPDALWMEIGEVLDQAAQ
jgi:hypothetical protein